MRLFVALALSFAVALPLAAQTTAARFRAGCAAFTALLRAELARCTAAGIDDAYKFAHQAAMGSEHAIPDAMAAAAWMAREWATLDAPPAGERLIDTIAPGGRLVRLNLRPWRARGGAAAPVVAAFVATAHGEHGDTARLSRYLRSVEAAAASGALRAMVPQVRARVDQLRRRGFPAIEHSAAYERTCRPAYRVLTGALAESLATTVRGAPR